MKTLAELNANPRTTQWPFNDPTYTLETVWAVGSQSRRWGSSEKTHLLRVDRVVAVHKPVRRTEYQLGANFSVHAVCNTNGQHTGTPYKGVDTDALTCQKCLGKSAQR